MPRFLPSPSEVVHLWVKQGKTDHMAKLEDANVLSKIQERRESSSSSSFSISSLLVSDVVPDESSMVEVRWSSTNQRDFVEASTIRFRDLESEGRPSRRRGGRLSTAPPQAASAPVRRKKRNTKNPVSSTTTTKTDVALPAKKRRKVLSPKRAGPQVANSKIESVETSANSSIVTREGRDDDLSSLEQRSIDSKDSKSLPRSGIDTIEKNQNHSIDNPNAIAKAAPVENATNAQKSSETTETSCRKQIPSSPPKNVIDLEDEDFDSSDDEAIEYRMKMKYERNMVKIEQEEKCSTSADAKNISKPNDDSTAATSRGSKRKIAHRKRKRITIPSESESDHDYIDSGSESESFSAPTEASSRRGKRRYPNGYDSQEDDDDDQKIPADDGKTNTSNWEKMKQFFQGKNFV